jgi:hypothetical protein
MNYTLVKALTEQCYTYCEIDFLALALAIWPALFIPLICSYISSQVHIPRPFYRKPHALLTLPTFSDLSFT